MKKFLSCSGCVVGVVIIAVLAVLFACVATVAVPILNADVLQQIACPPDTTLVKEWTRTTYTKPGEKVLAVYCLDKDGHQLKTQDLGYGALEYFPRYLAISVAALLAITLLMAGVFLLIRLARQVFGGTA